MNKPKPPPVLWGRGIRLRSLTYAMVQWHKFASQIRSRANNEVMEEKRGEKTKRNNIKGTQVEPVCLRGQSLFLAFRVFPQHINIYVVRDTHKYWCPLKLASKTASVVERGLSLSLPPYLSLFYLWQTCAFAVSMSYTGWGLVWQRKCNVMLSATFFI